MTLLIAGLAVVGMFELSDSWHLVASGVWSLAIAGLGLVAISRIKSSAPRTEQPPWQVRLAAALTMTVSLVSLKIWGTWPFVISASIGLVIVLAIGNQLNPHPDSPGVLAGKITLLFAAVAGIIFGTVLLINEVEPIWLGLALAMSLLAASVVLAGRFARWEAARAEAKAAD